MKRTHNNNNNITKNTKFKPRSKKRENKCIITFDEKNRQDYLTGFHKRKVERRKAAVEEIKKKIKEEQIKVREGRHKEYLKLLKERKEALDEGDDKDELEDAITATTESIQYDHPNHTVTVTTICDLDLTGSHLLGPVSDQVIGENDKEETKTEEAEKKTAMPKKAGNPFLNKKIRSLTASLNTFTVKRSKNKTHTNKKHKGRTADKKVYETESKSKGGRTTKRERRRRTGRNETFKM
ncbi:nucleolar protein 12 [Eucyclogobius newberryi]|uniref:nucleolar protein 12 n=1 Tax=Eucyclogobius newberryi TaxID=166745 RepID=UPI003B5BD233